MTIYEVHLSSWRRDPDDPERELTYAELADELTAYCRDLGFTHVELLPVMAHPVLGLVGLPGHLVLRAHAAPRLARRLPRLRRPDARRGHRRAPRLGAGALPARRLGARALRRHRAVRARGPAPRRAPRLGHARLQLRPQRGPQLPAGQRPVLAARAPRGRHPRRRRRVDALPRLLAQGGGVDPERVRRARGPRRGRVPQGAQRGHARARARRRLGRRGVDGLAGRLAADVRRRPRVRLQVEHGVDARHAGVLPAGPGLPPLPPPPADVQPRLRLQRELHPAAEPRRGRPRQGLAAGEDAGRQVAEARQPARAVRLHVGPPRQEAALHGPGARPGARVEPRAVTGLAPARGPGAPGRPAPRARPQPRLPRPAGPVGGRLRSVRLLVAGAQRRRQQHRRVLPRLARGRGRGRLRHEPLAGPPPRLPRRASRARAAGARR